MTLPLEVALSYLRARSSRLVSSVSLLSISGIGLGVAALVVAMGLLSGYQREIRENLIGANAEVVLFPLSTTAEADPSAAQEKVAKLKRVRATAPVVYQSGLASSAATPDGSDVVLKGIDPAAERRVSRLDAYLPDAERVLTRASAAGRPGVAIGAELARLLDVKEGDTMTFTWRPGVGLEVAMDDKVRGSVPGDAFARTLFTVWFGPEPGDENLKRGMLGQ